MLLFRLLPKELAAETFVEMDSDLQERLLQSFTDTELRGVIAELFVDDMVDIIEEMPANVVKRILASADAETRAAVNEILALSAGQCGEHHDDRICPPERRDDSRGRFCPHSPRRR